MAIRQASTPPIMKARLIENGEAASNNNTENDHKSKGAQR